MCIVYYNIIINFNKVNVCRLHLIKLLWKVLSAYIIILTQYLFFQKSFPAYEGYLQNIRKTSTIEDYILVIWPCTVRVYCCFFKGSFSAILASCELKMKRLCFRSVFSKSYLTKKIIVLRTFFLMITYAWLNLCCF